MKYNVVELFDSIDGEGVRTGQPATFIRLAGCNLRCTYCDTLYALFGEAEPCRYEEWTLDGLLSRVNPVYRRVTLTGGEPLISPGAAELVSALSRRGYEVNIETNGAVDICAFLKDCTHTEHVFFTIDYKLPSSGMEQHMHLPNFRSLRPQDVLKFVVGSEEDAARMLELLKAVAPACQTMPHIYVGAVYGAYPAQRLVELILQEPLLKDSHLQVQLHKIIWDPDKRGV
ncbi:MAG TPA: radical SAM protein [Candidatus Avimonoglobus intestinipullorum]|uniref:7-carboxy-7-deazaguanine synthase n=1 Tax=Candidatus Avimonoglobus intestinipullorum TaxID=2840699 RepID=A0A9D1S5Y5_9FIRM|nr:radical SAM protein [Candidatus Avimonoglobus intestinipullorum]